MTAEQISEALILTREAQNPGLLHVPNVYLYEWECDVLEVTVMGNAHEFEIKVTEADFKQDARKGKHRILEEPGNRVTQSRPNQFSYVCPAGMLRPHDIPKYAGLVWVKLVPKASPLLTGYAIPYNESNVILMQTIVPAPQIHNLPLNSLQFFTLARRLALKNLNLKGKVREERRRHSETIMQRGKKRS